MRILHVITGLQTGGAEMMLYKLLKEAGGEWEPMVVSLTGRGPIGEWIERLGVPVRCLGMTRSVGDFWKALPLVGIARKFKPQLIQGWMYHGNLAATAAGAGIWKRTPVIWSIRNSLTGVENEKTLSKMVIGMSVRLSKRPERIVYNSRAAAAQHEKRGFAESKTVVVPNGFDCQVFRPNEEARRKFRAEIGASDKEILVGLAGRLHPVKNHEGFLRAAGIAARKNSALRFLLVGRGTPERREALRKIIAEEGLGEKIRMIKERADMPDLTAALDIACSSSVSEGFSNTVGEAMSCAVPCVVTDVGDSAYLIGETGSVVAPNDAEAFAQALIALAGSSPERRRELGIAARRRIEVNFALSRVASEYKRIYENAIEGGCEAGAVEYAGD